MINNTHSLEQVEALMWKESNILMDPNVGKEAKKESRKRLKLLERHHRECSDKHINGKKYPVRKVPKDISKKELLALIDSVQVRELDNSIPDFHIYRVSEIMNRLDTSGVNPGSSRFTFKEAGW